MSPSANPYTKLPGTGHQFGSYTRLYRGTDHLLQVSSAGFSERYKRFYLRDIQAFIVVRTIWWVVGIAFAGLLALGFAGIALAVSVPTGTIVCGSTAGLFTLIALSHAVRGPTCRCYVRTAVQTEKLPSLNRVRKTNKVLATLQPLIEAAQEPVPEPPSTGLPLATEQTTRGPEIAESEFTPPDSSLP